jgi:hypothetical protein
MRYIGKFLLLIFAISFLRLERVPEPSSERQLTETTQSKRLEIHHSRTCAETFDCLVNLFS